MNADQAKFLLALARRQGVASRTGDQTMIDKPQKVYSNSTMQAFHDLGYWKQAAKNYKAEAEMWKERCEALQRDFKTTLDAPCPYCGEKP